MLAVDAARLVGGLYGDSERQVCGPLIKGYGGRPCLFIWFVLHVVVKVRWTTSKCDYSSVCGRANLFECSGRF